MTLAEMTKTRGLKVATTALVISAAVFLWTVVGAIRAEPLPAATAMTPTNVDAMRRAPLHPPVDVQAAVEKDLFADDRVAPATPYRMLGEESPNAQPKATPVKPTLLGTAIAEDGRSFATLQLSDTTRLVHIGSKLGDWIVRSIARGKVVLETNDGARAELAVPHPGT